MNLKTRELEIYGKGHDRDVRGIYFTIRVKFNLRLPEQGFIEQLKTYVKAIRALSEVQEDAAALTKSIMRTELMKNSYYYFRDNRKEVEATVRELLDDLMRRYRFNVDSLEILYLSSRPPPTSVMYAHTRAGGL